MSNPGLEMRMKSSCSPRGLLLGAVLASTALVAAAAGTEPRPMSETELSDVYGRGLSEPTLTAFAALTTQEQGGSYASAPSGDAAAALGMLSGDGAQTLERQMAQQRFQAATSGAQTTLKLAQTLTIASQVLVPIGGLVLPALPFPLLITLPTLPSLPAINGKH
jgi:hypothetical protein